MRNRTLPSSRKVLLFSLSFTGICQVVHLSKHLSRLNWAIHDDTSIDTHVGPDMSSLVAHGEISSPHMSSLPTFQQSSQCGEDRLVAGLLNHTHNAYFLDLFTNNSISPSNTFRLEADLNWKGLCASPGPGFTADSRRRTCKVIPARVLETTSEKQIQLKDRFVQQLERFKVPSVVDYMSIGAKTGRYFVMQNNFPFDRYTFKIITVEQPNQGLIDVLHLNDYRYLASFTKNETEIEAVVMAHASALPFLNMSALQQHPGWLNGETRIKCTSTNVNTS